MPFLEIKLFGNFFSKLAIFDKGAASIPHLYFGPFFLTIIGSYSIQNNILNVYFMFFFGLIGWILNRAGFKASPIVLGLVLGQIAEQGFVQSYIIGNAQENIIANYFAKPISIVLVILILMGLFLPTLKKIYNKKRGNLNDQR